MRKGFSRITSHAIYPAASAVFGAWLTGTGSLLMIKSSAILEEDSTPGKPAPGWVPAPTK
jgi:hypothetical protein